METTEAGSTPGSGTAACRKDFRPPRGRTGKQALSSKHQQSAIEREVVMMEAELEAMRLLFNRAAWMGDKTAPTPWRLPLVCESLCSPGVNGEIAAQVFEIVLPGHDEDVFNPVWVLNLGNDMQRRVGILLAEGPQAAQVMPRYLGRGLDLKGPYESAVLLDDQVDLRAMVGPPEVHGRFALKVV